MLVSRATIDKMAANKHEVEHAQQEGIEIIGGVTPVAVVVDAKGRATALRVADFVMEGKETKLVEGTERDLPADLIVSAIGQGVDFTGLEQFNNNNGLMKADKNYRFPGNEHSLRRRRRDAPAPADHRDRPCVRSQSTVSMPS